MHRPIFGHSFAVLVAPVLLSVLAFNFLNKKRTNSDGSSPSPTGNCYEVFLSFRGPDIRDGFTDHLYNGLIDAGIDAFRDDDELCHDEDIRPVLMEAITSSKILIPIFSMNYGRSSWCLDELVQIMESKNKNGQMVLPIFYKVKPADVGHQIGRFGEAFHRREKRLLGRSSFDAVTLEKWKKALLEVSTLKGYEVQRYEAELVKLIVQKVLNELKKEFKLVISENLVGVDSHVKKILEFVDNKCDATLFVGIHGMGGIGKTTLAKTIYNKLSNQFEHRSFIADIRESWKRGAHDLQNQLIYDISNQKNEVRNKDEGINFISSRFKDKKVLLLLDDVDEVDQVKCLAGNHDWFSLGSRIIITTRNKRILEEVGVDYPYDHKEMDKDQSLILFSKHAFRRDSPPREFKDLTHEVVSIAAGLPLSLEIFGSLLCGKESKQWRETIKKLKKVPNRQVREKLRISYEALDYGQKQIFLDIACFFIGKEKTIPFYMWDACDFFPGEGIEVLIFMSLIKVQSDDTLRMHDQLRDLGREIVHEENQLKPSCRSRLWDYEEVEKVLKESKGTDKIEGINLSEGNSEGFGKIARQDGRIYIEKQFKNLTNLRFLHLDGAHLSGDFKDLMEELRWLRWPYCPANFEVNNFCIKELAVLELRESKINEKWEGWSFIMMAEKLKYLDLSHCESLENTDFLSAFKKLEVLILNWCRRLKRIDVPNSGRLKELKAEGCKNLAKIQGLNSLEFLERLDISKCTSIGRLILPKSKNRSEYLETLNIEGCTSIERLDLSKSRRLKELKAEGCTNLAEIQDLDSLEFLERLDISKCTSIGRLILPKSGRLKELKAKSCRNLTEIQGLDTLEFLERLHISKCARMWIY